MKHEFTPSYSPPIYATRALKMLRYMGDCSDGQFRTHGRGWKLYELNKKELKNPGEFDLFITFCTHLKNHAELEASQLFTRDSWDDEDPVDEYFDCISSCTTDDKECQSDCVDTLKEES
jgi:hypothetical protein